MDAEIGKFKQWLKHAQPREWLVYGISGLKNNPLRERAWKAACEGKIALFQRRVGGEPSYECQRLGRPLPGSLTPIENVTDWPGVIASDGRRKHPGPKVKEAA